MDGTRRRRDLLELYRTMFALQRSVRFQRIRPRSVLADPDAGIRVRLLRAGAAWLIGWSGLMLLLSRASS